MSTAFSLTSRLDQQKEVCISPLLMRRSNPFPGSSFSAHMFAACSLLHFILKKGSQQISCTLPGHRSAGTAVCLASTAPVSHCPYTLRFLINIIIGFATLVRAAATFPPTGLVTPPSYNHMRAFNTTFLFIF